MLSYPHFDLSFCFYIAERQEQEFEPLLFLVIKHTHIIRNHIFIYIIIPLHLVPVLATIKINTKLKREYKIGGGGEERRKGVFSNGEKSKEGYY